MWDGEYALVDALTAGTQRVDGEIDRWTYVQCRSVRWAVVEGVQCFSVHVLFTHSCSHERIVLYSFNQCPCPYDEYIPIFIFKCSSDIAGHAVYAEGCIHAWVQRYKTTNTCMVMCRRTERVVLHWRTRCRYSRCDYISCSCQSCSTLLSEGERRTAAKPDAFTCIALTWDAP
jgi:hypothetical protein